MLYPWIKPRCVLSRESTIIILESRPSRIWTSRYEIWSIKGILLFHCLICIIKSGEKQHGKCNKKKKIFRQIMKKILAMYSFKKIMKVNLGNSDWALDETFINSGYVQWSALVIRSIVNGLKPHFLYLHSHWASLARLKHTYLICWGPSGCWDSPL